MSTVLKQKGLEINDIITKETKLELINMINNGQIDKTVAKELKESGIFDSDIACNLKQRLVEKAIVSKVNENNHKHFINKLCSLFKTNKAEDVEIKDAKRIETRNRLIKTLRIDKEEI